jgi:hypothetical protein
MSSIGECRLWFYLFFLFSLWFVSFCFSRNSPLVMNTSQNLDHFGNNSSRISSVDFNDNAVSSPPLALNYQENHTKEQSSSCDESDFAQSLIQSNEEALAVPQQYQQQVTQLLEENSQLKLQLSNSVIHK